VRQWERVDDALDTMIARDPNMRTFERTEMATVLGETPAQTSHLLQLHRLAQGRGLTRYVVAARGYARSALWLILAAPGATIGTTRRRRLALGHAEHVAADAAQRVMKDIKTEIDPSVVHHPAVTAYMAHAAANLAAQVRATYHSVHAAVELVEQVTGETADRTGVKIP